MAHLRRGRESAAHSLVHRPPRWRPGRREGRPPRYRLGVAVGWGGPGAGFALEPLEPLELPRGAGGPGAGFAAGPVEPVPGVGGPGAGLAGLGVPLLQAVTARVRQVKRIPRRVFIEAPFLGVGCNSRAAGDVPASRYGTGGFRANSTAALVRRPAAGTARCARSFFLTGGSTPGQFVDLGPRR